jgi:hypothetical protein
MPDGSRKPDAERIRGRLAALQTAAWLGKKWWPKYVYHFAELRNAVSILESGQLLCRQRGAMRVDTASEQVLDATDEKWKGCARLYFRPRTPTQHQVEGFRPRGQYGSLGKHCAMPFVFMFDAEDVLTRESTKFSEGNLAAANVSVDVTADFFEQIPFEKVFHDGAMSATEKAAIKFHRCAEVLVPVCLELSALRYVWCRSPAEYQTLFNSLAAAKRRLYQKKFGVGAQADVHFRFWTFLEDVNLEPSRIVFRFNPSTKTPGPFHARATIISSQHGELVWEDAQFKTSPSFVLNLSVFTEPVDYTVRFELDDQLAYLGQFKASDRGLVGVIRK